MTTILYRSISKKTNNSFYYVSVSVTIDGEVVEICRYFVNEKELALLKLGGVQVVDKF